MGELQLSQETREVKTGHWRKAPNLAAFQYKTSGCGIGGPGTSARGCAGDAGNWKPGRTSAQEALDAQIPFPTLNSRVAVLYKAVEQRLQNSEEKNC